MGDITELLHAARPGDGQALDAVFDKVYSSLRATAAQRLFQQPGECTLSATELVHEVYLKLTDARRLDLIDRHHFFACAARAMRQILVDRARARGAVKRGSGLVADSLDEAGDIAASGPELLEIDIALDRLEAVSPRLRELVEMRVFAGLTLAQLAQTSGCSQRTISRDWQRARALLLAQLDVRA